MCDVERYDYRGFLSEKSIPSREEIAVEIVAESFALENGTLRTHFSFEKAQGWSKLFAYAFDAWIGGGRREVRIIHGVDPAV